MGSGAGRVLTELAPLKEAAGDYVAQRAPLWVSILSHHPAGEQGLRSLDWCC